jgi:hypothetical protein
LLAGVPNAGKAETTPQQRLVAPDGVIDLQLNKASGRPFGLVT